MGRSDLEPVAFPRVSWEEADRLASLDTLYAYVEQQAIRSATWYFVQKRAKARWSRGLRITAILLTTAGAALPLVALATDDVAPEWGYLLLALAAGAVGLDRFFGLSSGWMRYLTTELAIHDALQRFQWQWAGMRLRLEGRRPTIEETVEQLDALAAAAAAVQAEVRNETLAWADEFRRNVADLRAMVEEAQQRREARPGPPSEPAAEDAGEQRP